MRAARPLLPLALLAALSGAACISSDPPKPRGDGGECGGIGDRCETDDDCCAAAGYRVSCADRVCVERID